MLKRHVSYLNSLKKRDLLLAVKESDNCNFADDTTMYANGKYIESVILNLEEDLSEI